MFGDAVFLGIKGKTGELIVGAKNGVWKIAEEASIVKMECREW